MDDEVVLSDFAHLGNHPQIQTIERKSPHAWVKTRSHYSADLQSTGAMRSSPRAHALTSTLTIPATC
jgi:hypothetical protein